MKQALNYTELPSWNSHGTDGMICPLVWVTYNMRTTKRQD